MANSSMISDIKNKILTEIINDDAFFHAINSPDIHDVKDSAKLIGTHLFRYNQNPFTLDKTITYLTFQVHIPENKYANDYTWTKVRLEIWIISHEKCMNVNNIPKITADRNDYISQLLDEKFNGRHTLGLDSDNKKINLFGALELVSNIEGAFQADYLYRCMVFETKDLNDSLCDGGKFAIE